MNGLIKRIIGKIRQLSRKPYNMYRHPAERYYFDLYRQYMVPHLQPGARILEIGCQYGRFTIPFARMGYRLHATDIKDHYFKSIEQRLTGQQVAFSKESIHETAHKRSLEEFDAVLCLELLYTLPDYQDLLKAFAGRMRKGSIFTGSHRSPGYYAYRLIGENKPEELKQILNNQHPVFNAQDDASLRKIYEDAGFKILSIVPIGIFSGTGKDHFSHLADPGKMDETRQKHLKDLETDPVLQKLFMNNARYLLVIAEVL